MERIVHHSALESSNLISQTQHGFRNKQFTVTLLVSGLGFLSDLAKLNY